MVERQSMKFPRRPAKIEDPDGPQIDLEDVQVWDLFDAFGRVMESIGQRADRHEVIYDDTPVELHAADILDRLQREGPLTFTRIFEGRTVRSEIVGLFLAMLELVRQRQVFASQEDNFRDIHIHLNPNPPTPEELAEQDRIVEERMKAAEEQRKRELEEKRRLEAEKLAAKLAAEQAEQDGEQDGERTDEQAAEQATEAEGD